MRPLNLRFEFVRLQSYSWTSKAICRGSSTLIPVPSGEFVVLCTMCTMCTN
jgi:hypothetical protein